MYNITAYLTIKNKTFYTVLTYYVEGQRKLNGFLQELKKMKVRKKLKRNLFKYEMNLKKN